MQRSSLILAMRLFGMTQHRGLCSFWSGGRGWGQTARRGAGRQVVAPPSCPRHGTRLSPDGRM